MLQMVFRLRDVVRQAILDHHVDPVISVRVEGAIPDRKSLRRNGAAKTIPLKRCKMAQKKCKNSFLELGRPSLPHKQTKRRGWNRKIREILPACVENLGQWKDGRPVD